MRCVGRSPLLEVILFTIVAVALYFMTDWILRTVEQHRGEPLPNRNIIFFVIILVLAITSFEFIQRVLMGGPAV